MDKLKQTFEESDLFKLNANYPDVLALEVIKKVGGLNEEQIDHVVEGFRELGFFMTNAARASYRLTHAVDLIRNQGEMGPAVRYLVMESSSELTNAVLFIEPMVRVAETLKALDENIDDWQSDVPADLPDVGIEIVYLRNFKDVVPGRLLNFRYQDIENKTVITDMPCIYDEELHAFMPLTNNPAWKLLTNAPDNDETGITDAIAITYADDQKGQESTDGGSN